MWLQCGVVTTAKPKIRELHLTSIEDVFEGTLSPLQI